MPEKKPTLTSAKDTDQIAPLVQMVRDNNATLTAIAEKQKRIEELESKVREVQETMRRQAISMPGSESLLKSGEFQFNRIFKSLWTGRRDDAPAEWALSDECKKRISGDQQNRVMTTLNDSTGGFLVPEEISSTLVPKLDAQSVMIGKMGVTVVQPKGYPFRVNKITGGTTAYMAGEGSSAVAASDLTLGQVNFYPKKCSARTVLTQEQVMWGTPQTDGLVMNDLTTRIALKEDQQIIAGLGSENEVYGIVPAGATTATTGYSTYATTSTGQVLFGDLNLAMADLAEVDALNDDVRAVMHPRAKFNLFRQLVKGVATDQTEAGGAGFLAGMPLATDARFKELTGITLGTTTQMPLTYNSNETWIFVGGLNGFSGYWFARFGGLVLSKSDVASDGTHHAFVEDKLHVKATTWFDGAAVQPLSICIITGYLAASID